jgi:hypothetical protein
VYETGMNDSVRKTLVGLNAICSLPVDVSFDNRVDALKAAVEKIRANSGNNKKDAGETAPVTS